MNINYKQNQFELFNKSAAKQQENGKARVLVANVNLTLENLVIFVILSIITLLFSFSVGVQRGERLAKNGMEEQIGQSTQSQEPVTVASLTEQEPIIMGAAIDTNILVSAAQDIVGTQERLVAPEDEMIEVSSSEGNYTIQVASFKTRKYAVQEAKALRSQGHDAFVQKKGTHVIVCIGRFQEKTDAGRFAKQLQKQYSDYLIRSL